MRYIDRTSEQYRSLGYGQYVWVHEPTVPPWQPLTKPLAECRLGVVASGGIYARGQTAFTFKDDTTNRAISTDNDTAELRAEKTVEVKRYVLPKFKTAVTTDKKFYLPKETVKQAINIVRSASWRTTAS